MVEPTSRARLFACVCGPVERGQLFSSRLGPLGESPLVEPLCGLLVLRSPRLLMGSRHHRRATFLSALRILEKATLAERDKRARGPRLLAASVPQRSSHQPMLDARSVPQ